MTHSSSSTDPHILEAIQSIWANSSHEGPGTGIVPLYDLIANFPIWVAEVEHLSIECAANYLAERTGQKPELGIEGSGPLSGFFYAYIYRGTFVGCILVEKRDPVARRRFSAAHELGHYILHFEPWLEQLTPDQSEEGVLMTDTMVYPEQVANGLTAGAGNAMPIRMGDIIQQPAIIIDDKQEAEANQFAASLLMPESILRERIAEFRPRVGQPRGYLASRLASEFLVSKEAMIYRLAALEL